MNRWLTGIEFICLIGCFDPSSDSFYGNLGCLFLSMAVSAVIAWKKAKKLHLHGCYNAGKDCVFMILTVATRFGTQVRMQSSPVFGWKMKKYFIYETVRL